MFCHYFFGCGSDSTPDTIPPTITISPATTSYDLVVGEDVPPLTISATDNKDGDLTAHIVVSGDQGNNMQAGSYVVSYDVADSAGNSAETTTIIYNYSGAIVDYSLIFAGDRVESGTVDVVEASIVELYLDALESDISGFQEFPNLKKGSHY